MPSVSETPDPSASETPDIDTISDAAFLSNYADNYDALTAIGDVPMEISNDWSVLSRTDLNMADEFYEKYFTGDYLYTYNGAAGYIAINNSTGQIALVFAGSDEPWVDPIDWYYNLQGQDGLGSGLIARTIRLRQVCRRTGRFLRVGRTAWRPYANP